MFGRPIGKCKRLARYARPASLSARGVVYCGNGYARYARATRCKQFRVRLATRGGRISPSTCICRWAGRTCLFSASFLQKLISFNYYEICKMVEDFSIQSNVLYLHTRVWAGSPWHPVYNDHSHIYFDYSIVLCIFYVIFLSVSWIIWKKSIDSHYSYFEPKLCQFNHIRLL